MKDVIPAASNMAETIVTGYRQSATRDQVRPTQSAIPIRDSFIPDFNATSITISPPRGRSSGHPGVRHGPGPTWTEIDTEQALGRVNEETPPRLGKASHGS